VPVAFPFPFPLAFARGTSSSVEERSDSSEEKSPKDISSSCLEAIREFKEKIYDHPGVFFNPSDIRDDIKAERTKV
jgi:hypothetical protein